MSTMDPDQLAAVLATHGVSVAGWKQIGLDAVFWAGLPSGRRCFMSLCLWMDEEAPYFRCAARDNEKGPPLFDPAETRADSPEDALKQALKRL